MSKLARAIANMEGFGRAGAIPTIRHNPGDLRHSPHSTHAPGHPDDIGTIDTDEHGWTDLERQLRLYAQRGLTLQEAIRTAAPPNENDSESYLSFVCRALVADVPLAQLLELFP